MLDMKHEYALARKYVQDELNFSSVGLVIVFETTIRILGSLISTFHLTADELYLRKAEELGVRLASSFETRNGLPWPRCYLNVTGVCTVHDNLGDSIYIAEVGTLQLEFRALSHHSRHPLVKRLRVVVERIVGYLQNAPSTTRRLSYEALVPYAMSLSKGMYNTNMVTLGAPADSYFEYLVKVWIQGGRRETAYWNMFADVVDGMLNIAVYTSSRGDTLVRDVLPDANGVKFQHKMDHFACFLPGAIILGIEGLPKNDERRGKWEWLATELTETCFNMYARSPSGLSGEHIRLGANDEWRMSGGYQLRPEALESFYYMYVYTGDEKYRRYAWAVFESIEKHCRLDEGYAALKSARSRHPKKEDVMHSFLISETFKYLYMIFGEDMLGDGWVLNTEAHPFLIMPGLDIGNDTCGEGQKAAYEEHDEL